MESALMPDLPPAPIDDEKDDPTWEADGIHWSSSSDDEEESLAGMSHISPLSDSGPGASATLGKSELANGSQVVISNNVTDRQKSHDAPRIAADGQLKDEPLGPRRGGSFDSDSSLASIPAAIRLKETPVPLPSTVAAPGLLPTPVSSQLGRPSLPYTTSLVPPPARPVPPAPPARPASGPPSISTPVPLPPTTSQSTPAVQVIEKTTCSSASVTKRPDMRTPAAASGTPSTRLEQTRQFLTEEKAQPATSPGAFATSMEQAACARPIELATDGRQYTIYFDPYTRKEIATRGVLIPEGYKLHTDPLFPFICPVRDCRRILKTLYSISGHWRASHNNMMFNDNRDGTLSKIKPYKNASGCSPGIVVSQVSIPSTAPPPAEPRLPGHEARVAKRQWDEPEIHQDSKRRFMPEFRGGPYMRFMNPVAYMAEVHFGRRTSTRPDIVKMLRLPRKRDLPKEFLDRHERGELSPQIYACAVAYIVGDELFGSRACHAATGPLARLSKQCIVLPSSIQSEPSIARMFSPHNRAADSRTRASSARSLAEMPVPRPSEEASLRRQQSSPAPLVRESEHALAGRRAVRQSVLNRLHVDRDLGERVQAERKAQSEQSDDTQLEPATRIQQQGQFGTPDYELEAWEIAPGRVASEDSTRNVAYSGAFLTSSTPITISPDVCFNVLTIRPGQTYKVQVQKDRMQVFSVASGKVKVKTGGKAVQLGPNGAFPVRPGENCLIENRIYFEAVVHCTTVKDYELA
ncbi:Cupin, RmlC-type [Metarhizium album ARSEF 1941]|uniref:Cupin, RmlC-type n=1 Tax=Metarhizium album (strain ARSEF 1941) TaxID=1081103 RepID=A0A0B2WLX0_METAS|nr:Cupin, RmlC-type [Metarhizium album ARSEF 1941]KHN94938.1 Cupin, RmlC-type [Metarhizium album ARSEF 1941]